MVYPPDTDRLGTGPIFGLDFRLLDPTPGTIRSKWDIRVGGRSILREAGWPMLYLEPTRLAAARVEVRAFEVVIIPALATNTFVVAETGAMITVT